ncbi:lamin tail domain-containing protein [Halohasta salina]|uniref:lamin tail domain-containing protein n=1 Tax=Halohasta salina TaxID=2961621 RepID=UPI0020A4A83F|nr:lamin tail domain-containing protein [Halohasta salina]
MSITQVRKAGKKYAKRYARLTVVSAVVAAVLTAIVGAVVDPSRIAVLPEWLDRPAFVAVFVQAFAACFALGLLGRVLARNWTKLKTLWTESIGGPLADRWRGLTRRTQAVLVGLVAAVVTGGLIAGVDHFTAVPRWLLAVGPLLTWPAGTYLGLARHRPTVDGGRDDNGGKWRRYAELRHLETRTIALLIGYLIAAATGGGIRLLGVNPAVTVAVGLSVWLVATVVVYDRYERVLTERSALAIVDDTDPASGREGVELTIANTDHEPIALPSPTLVDTAGDRYRLAERLTVQPGGTVTVELPAAFRLTPIDAERTLPLGYTLDRSRAAPSLYTETGTAFALQPAETDDEPAWSAEVAYDTEPVGRPAAHGQD